MTKNRQHILFLNSWYPSKVSPSNGDFIQRHAEAVATIQQVTCVHVITDESISENFITDNHINGVRTLIAYLKPVNSNIIKQVQFFKAYNKLINMSGDFEIIHVNRIFPAGIMTFFNNKPFLVTEHFSGYLQEHFSKLSIFERFIVKKITMKAAYVCPVSNYLAKNMQKIGCSGHYKVIPNVIDTKLFYPLKKENAVFTLIHISSLNDSIKNISGILRVIRRLQDDIENFQFILIGPQPERFKTYINKLGIDTNRVKITGEIPHKKVPEYIQKSNVFVLFSRYETFSCVIKEAFACGVPVISTNIGGIKENFPKGFGKLISNENSLLDAILEIYHKGVAANKEDMHLYVKTNFSQEIISNSYSKLYHRMLNNN